METKWQGRTLINGADITGAIDITTRLFIKANEKADASNLTDFCQKERHVMSTKHKAKMIQR